jgi:hypothetical protein
MFNITAQTRIAHRDLTKPLPYDIWPNSVNLQSTFPSVKCHGQEIHETTHGVSHLFLQFMSQQVDRSYNMASKENSLSNTEKVTNMVYPKVVQLQF